MGVCLQPACNQGMMLLLGLSWAAILRSSGFDPQEVLKQIAAEEPEHAEKMRELLDQAETIDYGCESPTLELDFSKPETISKICQRLKCFWDGIFFELGFYPFKPVQYAPS